MRESDEKQFDLENGGVRLGVGKDHDLNIDQLKGILDFPCCPLRITKR